MLDAYCEANKHKNKPTKRRHKKKSLKDFKRLV